MRLPFLHLAALLLATPLAAQTRAGGALDAPASLGFGTDVALAGDELFATRTGAVPTLPAPPSHPGAVLLFRRGADGQWTEHGKVVATDVGLADEFGASIAVRGDWLAVGAPKHGTGGAVFLFQRRAGAWTQVAKLTGPVPAPGDEFGAAVALDEQRLVVGAPGTDSTRGAAYASRRDARSGGWTPLVRIAGGAEVSDRLGEAVAVSGTRALVGAPGLLRGGNNPFAPAGSQRVKAGTVLVLAAAPSGAWSQEAVLDVGTDTTRSFGAALLLDGDDAFVGAPRTARGAGAVYAYRRSGATWQQVARLRPATGEPPMGFGSALARTGGQLLVGAPFAGKNAGAVHVFARGADGWSESQALVQEGAGNRMLGSRLAAHGDHAVASVPLADNGMGRLAAFARVQPAGTWRETGTVVDSPVEMAKVTGGEVKCATGKAGGFDCGQVDLLAYLPPSALGAKRGMNFNDIWGWTDARTGREYALLGRMDGTSFVDVTDPANPRFLGDLPMHEGARANMWRDIKVYKDHAFIVADGSGPHGMQVFDLTQLRDVQGAPVTFTETVHYDRIASAHNVAINEETGFAYVIGANGGGETCGGALHMVDIRDPRAPKFAGCFADPTTGMQRTGYTHDTQCVTYKGPDARYTGREICFNSSETALGIADVTDKASPKALGTGSYPNVAYTHQGWLSEDHKYFYVDDEGDEISGVVPKTRTLVWDVSKLDEPVLVKEFLGTTGASDHNLYVKGKYVYQSNYLAGLRILDISNPAEPRETGYFDTVPGGENVAGFAGSWSNYPYFPSGTIVVSSIGEGLFVLRHRPEAPAVP